MPELAQNQSINIHLSDDCSIPNLHLCVGRNARQRAIIIRISART